MALLALTVFILLCRGQIMPDYFRFAKGDIIIIYRKTQDMRLIEETLVLDGGERWYLI